MIPLYVLLGIKGSGRKDLLGDLVDAAESEYDGPVALISSPADPVPDGKIGKQSLEWSVTDGNLNFSKPPGSDICAAFLVADGTGNPVDLLDALRLHIRQNDQFELIRIITVVHCQLLELTPALRGWYDACTHFSDVVLLNRRENVSNKWLRDLTVSYEKQHLPCLVEMVKKGKVANAANILYAEARRYSLAFDTIEDEDPPPGMDFEIIIEGNVGEDFVDEDPREQEDPYFEKIAGRERKKKIPDLIKILSGIDK